MKGLTPIAALVLVLLARPAEAAEGGGLGMLLAQSLNLLLLLGVLVYFARKPLRTFFADRRNQIQGDLAEAAGLLEAAENRYAEWQAKLAAIEQESETIRNEGRRRAVEEGEAILADAQAAAERIHRDAAASAAQELRRAQAELRAEAAELATRMAEQILEEKLANPDRERLVDEFIARVEPGEN
ncbi:MAG: ATP synthase F0 subunit B [Myxococcota bacterium]|nr:ATP synthase F0 subunit B [Myxococcota bacterium]